MTAVNEMLENLMSKSFAEITEAKEKYDCTYRMAAYVVALKKLIYAEEIKGFSRDKTPTNLVRD